MVISLLLFKYKSIECMISFIVIFINSQAGVRIIGYHCGMTDGFGILFLFIYLWVLLLFIFVYIRFIIINMLGLLSMLLLLHAMISTLRWRKFVQANQEDFFLPFDVSKTITIDSSWNHSRHGHSLCFHIEQYHQIQSH